MNFKDNFRHTTLFERVFEKDSFCTLMIINVFYLKLISIFIELIYLNLTKFNLKLFFIFLINPI